MKDIAEQIIREHQLDIDVVLGELFEGVEKSREFRRLENDVIISRGGTAKLIRNAVDIPVVEVEVGGYDLLRCIYKHKHKKIAIIGSENVISGVKALQETMDLDIYYFPFVLDSEIEEKIELVCNMGVDIVIGDTVAVRIAKRRGLAFELIRSGKEAVKDAIDRALSICNAIMKEREKSLTLSTILQSSREGILVTNEDNEIVFLNPRAEKMLMIKEKEALGKSCASALKHLGIESVWASDSVVNNYIFNTNRYTIAMTKIPICVDSIVTGAVINFEDVTKIQEKEEKIRKILSKSGLVAKNTFDNVVGDSEEIRRTIHLAKKYAAIDSTILIYGESGTGKEMFAQSIHNVSGRRDGPFTAINCATLPGNLLESTLFGYDEGAFTGAKKGGKKGVFELAHNGTLLLDEIGEMDIDIQAKLLRVLQEKEVMRLGGENIIPVDVRIIAASNKRLIELVNKGLFREDLFYRINVLNIDIPSLRSRKGDIEQLAEYFMDHYCRKYSKETVSLEKSTLKILSEYSWPGNVRQFENVIQKIVLIGDGEDYQPEYLRGILAELHGNRPGEKTEQDVYTGSLDEINRRIILKILDEENYNKTRTAERLRITRVTLNKKLETV
jgi:transcriptional regulator with PAS, ATPase and Fis domain